MCSPPRSELQAFCALRIEVEAHRRGDLRMGPPDLHSNGAPWLRPKPGETCLCSAPRPGQWRSELKAKDTQGTPFAP